MRFFKKAKMISRNGEQISQDSQIGFRTNFNLSSLPREIKLVITGRTFFRVFLNGKFVFYGPARSAHEYVRVDVIDLLPFVKEGDNALAVELVTYRHGYLCVTGEYGFLQAEIVADGEIVSASDEKWQCAILPVRNLFVENFSHARGLSEVYDLDNSYYSWRDAVLENPSDSVVISDKSLNYLPRVTQLPDFSIVNSTTYLGSKKVVKAVGEEAITDYPMMVHSLDENDETGAMTRPVAECVNDRYLPFEGQIIQDDMHFTVTAGCEMWCLDFDFETTECGFIGLEFTASSHVIIDVIAVDSLSRSGEFQPRTCHSNTVVRVSSPAGHWHFESIEPLGIRYVRLIIRGCRQFKLDELFIRRYQYEDLPGGEFMCDSSDLNRIYNAARLNLIINSCDLFMDCPGRERGGWATDSFWSGRAARMMLGDCRIERAHLENFLAPTIGKYFPGSVPGCYPASDCCCIQNWTIFIGLELYEYFRRTNDMEFCLQYRASIDYLISTLSKYYNKFGVLEDLPEIIYVDGSSASNDLYNRPISTGTNAMFAVMLERLAEIYDCDEWRHQAERIKKVLTKVCDIRDTGETASLVPDSFSMTADGEIQVTRYCSEGGQYMCMWMDYLDIQKLPNYFKMMFDQFGCDPSMPLGHETQRVLRAELLVGMMVRFDLLQRYGEFAKLRKEIERLYLHMIDNGPGTLWEGWSPYSNLTHGYQSHVGYLIMRAFLGIHMPDAVSKTIKIAPHPTGLKWARGFTSVGETSKVEVDWSLSDELFTLNVEVPESYKVELELPSEIYGWEIAVSGNGNSVDFDGVMTTNRSFTLIAIKQ